MSLLVTDAIVLHTFDYRETSRILRLATREAGVRSVIARGARRPKSRYGSAIDLFAEGSAQIVMHPTGDLHTLAAFDITRARPKLAAAWGAFAAANALTEIMMRFARDDAQPHLFEAYEGALSSLETGDAADFATAGLAGAWRLAAELGFSPALDSCASCDTPVEPGGPARFDHRSGGVLCATCGTLAAGSRTLPADARAAISGWLAGDTVALADDRAARAHLRLLREFLVEHLADNTPLRAFAVWERGDWSAA